MNDNETLEIVKVQGVEQYSAEIVKAGNWDEKVRIAEEMIEGGLVPSSFNGEAGAVISAVEMGVEVGLGPWASLNNIIVISGKATLTLNAMLAIARSRGVLIKIIRDFEDIIKENEDGKKIVANRVTSVEITRGEDIYSPSGKLLESRVGVYVFNKYWTEAVSAKLITKENWVKMPRNMLRARAITEALRLYAPDLMLGIYESTEIGDANNITIDLQE